MFIGALLSGKVVWTHSMKIEGMEQSLKRPEQIGRANCEYGKLVNMDAW